MSRAVPANANHRVPEHARTETARTLAATPGIRGEPTDAERGRTLLAVARTAALATVSVEGGFPFGSLVAYAVDDVGRPLLCLSDLAEHSRNLAADRRASLMASETTTSTATGAVDPLALARVTVLGTVVELRDDLRAAALHTYRERHPDAFYAAFGDFRLYRLDVSSVRYVGGFGRMSWVSADDHAAGGARSAAPARRGHRRAHERRPRGRARRLLPGVREAAGDGAGGDGRGGPVRVHDARHRRGRHGPDGGAHPVRHAGRQRRRGPRGDDRAGLQREGGQVRRREQ